MIKLVVIDVDSIRKDGAIKHDGNEKEPNPGFKNFIFLCYMMDIPIYMLSKKVSITRKRLRKYNFESPIKKVVKINDKNIERRLFEIIKEEKRNPRQILYINDSREGVVSAGRLNIITVGFSGENGAGKDVLKAIPDFPEIMKNGKIKKIKTFQKIVDILLTIQKRGRKEIKN